MAIVHASELRELGECHVGRAARADARAWRRGLRALGVERGDRVAAYMPNIPEAVAAFLATASIGAIWSSCSPDFGARSVIDRFAQIEPKVLLAVDGYRYNGRDFDRRETVERHRRRGRRRRSSRSATSTARGWPDDPGGDARRSSRVPFDHPLWVLYSLRHDRPAEGDRPGPGRDPARAPQEAPPARRRAGRRPRVLVHDDRLDDVELPRLRACSPRRRSCSTTAAPASRTWACCGTSPSAPGVTTFGTSAAYIAACMKAGVEPADGRDLSRAARRRLDRLAAVARRASAGSTTTSARTPGCSPPAAAPTSARRSSAAVPILPGLRGRAAGARARRVGRGVGPRGPAADRRGRRARDHRADAVDAAVPVERPGRRALPRVLLRHVPRHLAPRRLDRDHRARHGDHQRPLGLDDQPRRRAHGHGRDLPRGAGRRRGHRRAGGRRRRGLDAAVRGAARGRRSSTTSSSRASARACARTARRATSRTRSWP